STRWDIVDELLEAEERGRLATVSETVSASGRTLLTNSGELGRILLENTRKCAILWGSESVTSVRFRPPPQSPPQGLEPILWESLRNPPSSAAVLNGSALFHMA